MGLRVLVTTPALLGHIHPMVPLARALADRGHEVLWALPADGVTLVEHRGVGAAAASAPLPIGPALALQRYPELRELRSEDVPTVMFGKLWGAIAAPPMLEGLAPIAHEWSPDLVVTDAAELAGHIVAAELGIPAVTKGFGPLLPELRVAAAADEVAPLWRSRGLEPRPYAGCYDTLYLDPYPPVLQAQATDHITRRQHVRFDSDVEEVGSPSEVALPLEPVGAPLAYVTMGTVFNTAGPLRLIVQALDELGLRALVTVGPSGDPGNVGQHAERIRVERYVPQGAVLPHCNLVVSHGGSGTILGALSAGLPQVCLPQGADQFLNAAAITAAGAGVALMPKEITQEAIADAIGRVLGDRSYRDAAQRVSQAIAAMPTVADATVTLESLVPVHRSRSS